MGSHVWKAIYGKLCVGSYVWEAIYGKLCVGSYVLEAICGKLCVGSDVWEAIYGKLCVGSDVKVMSITVMGISPTTKEWGDETPWILWGRWQKTAVSVLYLADSTVEPEWDTLIVSAPD